MQYSTGKHCVFYHRYHLVWSTKYRCKVLRGDIKLRVRDIYRQVCAENGVDIIRGVLSNDHVHMFVSVSPKLAISDLMRLIKGRSSHKVQREFPHLKSAIGDNGFGAVGTFQLQTVPSLRTSYFSTCKRISKILPTPVGSYLVI
jgi:putative transposase